jgi:hypothetical protein
MIQFVMESLIMEAIRAFGLALLKIATLGRYTSRRATDWAMEGIVGLAGVLAIAWMAYRWLS